MPISKRLRGRLAEFPRGNSRRMRWVLLASVVILFLVPLTSTPTNPNIDLEFPIIDFGPAGIGDNLEDFVDAPSNLHLNTPDLGTHSVFADLQDYGANYDQMLEVDTGDAGFDLEDYVDAPSNLHLETPDIGTHAGGGFAEMQDKDAVYDLLTEGDTGGGGIDEYKYVDTYPADAWSVTGTPPYLEAQDQPTNFISTSSNGIQTGWIGFAPTTGTGSGFTVVFSVYHDSASDSLIEWELDWTEDQVADASGTFSTAHSWAWEDDVEDLSALDTQAEIDACTVRFTHNKGSGGPDLLQIDAARLYITQAGGANYDLDLEVGWTTADFDETNEELCIFGGTQGSEALRVDYWTGSWTNVISDLVAGWNNNSVSITSEAFEIRFTDTTGDAVEADTWEVEGVLLHVWTAGSTNYELDLEIGWSTADFDETNEELCIYPVTGGGWPSEDIKVDIWTGSWSNVFLDLTPDTWNNQSVTLTGSAVEIRFLGGTESSDTEQDTWEIDAVLLHTWTTSYTPANDQAPTFDNPSDTDNAYAQYLEYQITVYVSDQNGFADIDYLEIGLWDDGQGTEYWRFRYDEDTDTFTEEYDSGTVVSLNTGGSSATEAGNDIDATFYFTVDWDHPDISETDAKCYVIDTQSEEDTDWYEVNWDIETRLDYSVAPAVTSDDAGTVDIGDLDETFLLGGTLIYYTSADDYPPSAQVDVWIAGSEYGSTPGPWSDLTLSSGAFEVTCYADDAVGQDTYTAKPVIESAGSGGTSLYYTTDLTDTYIATQVQVQSYSSDDGRININTAASDHVTLYYAHDSSFVADGTVTVNGVSASYSASNGIWDFGETKSTVQQVVYDTVAISGDAHGLTGVDQNSQTLNQIWDRIQVQSYSVSDDHDNINDNVDIDVTLWYDFDDTLVTDGTVTIEGIGAAHQGSGVWRITENKATIQLVTYNTVACSGNTHGLSTVDQNGQTQDVIWDKITVQTTVVDDPRVNVDGNAEVRVTLWLEFNDEYLGSGDSVTLDDVAMSWDDGNSWFELTRTQSTVDIRNYYVNSSSEATYGITVLEVNSQEVDVIWDRLNVDIQADDETPNNGIEVTFTLTVTFEYDSASCTTYEIAFTRDTVYWETFTNSNKSLFVDTNSDVSYDYEAVNVNTETLHGITVFTTNTETVTWAPGNYAPVNDTAPGLTDPHDTDHIYAWIQYYTLTSNVSDQDGYTDIIYVELSLYDNARGGEVWRIRYTVIGQAFSVELGGAYIDLSGSSVDESGNDIDITWLIRIDWDHDDLADIDTKQYVTDGEDTDTDWYESDWEVETRLDILDLAISESRGKTSRNDLSITGTVIYFESASELSPTTALIDVWADGPVSDKVDYDLSSGDFSITGVESSATVNLDVHIMKLVPAGTGVGGTNLLHNGHTVTYVSDMLKVTLSTGTPHVAPGVEVTVDVTVVYAYDDSAVSSYFADIDRDLIFFITINETDPSFTDVENEDMSHSYTVDGANESLYGITEVFWSNELTVIWGESDSPAGPGNPPNTDNETTTTTKPFDQELNITVLAGVAISTMFVLFYITREPKGMRRRA